MLFRKKIEPSCSYCRFGSRLNDEEAMCMKKGVVALGGQCRRFRYDPLRREPPTPVSLKNDDLSEADFTL